MLDSPATGGCIVNSKPVIFISGAVEVKMLKIGNFSRLSQVMFKTLHHYDEIGLFKPAKGSAANRDQTGFLRRVNELETTKTLENAIAPAASIGTSAPSMATGIRMML